jgi:hypothetical protein
MKGVIRIFKRLGRMKWGTHAEESPWFLLLLSTLVSGIMWLVAKLIRLL